MIKIWWPNTRRIFFLFEVEYIVRGERFIRVSLRNRTARRRGRQNVCVWQIKRDRAITCVFCRDLLLTLMFSCPLQKDLLKGRWSLAESFFKQNCCQLCHTMLAFFFPLPSCCLSSVIYRPATRKLAQLNRPSVFFHTTFEVYGSRIYTTASILSLILLSCAFSH